MTVSALYVDVERGPYPELLGSEACWGIGRDAKRFSGTNPVVAHPPCGPWGRLSQFCSSQDPTAALVAVGQVLRLGGVLEHPEHSQLWSRCGLPKPWGTEGQVPLIAPRVWTLIVDQCRWGHPARKRTWLLMVGIRPQQLPPIPKWQNPTRSLGKGRGIRSLPELPKSKRHLTPASLAAWLVACAERSQK